MNGVDEILERLDRMAAGIEKLAEDPVIHMETGPPVCPHCEKINPSVHVDERGGSGLLGEFVIQARCENCGKVFYGQPIQWHCYEGLKMLEQALQAQRELIGNGSNGKQSD